MLAYHGTEHVFDTFDESHIGRSMGIRSSYFYFTSDRENALFYGDRLLTVELDIRNPREFTATDYHGRSVRELADETVMDNFQQGAEWDGIVVRDVVDGTYYSDIFVPFDVEQIRIVKVELNQ